MGKDWFANLPEVVLELLVCPHVLRRQLGGTGPILAVLLDGIVRQVDGLVKVIKGVLL